MASLQRKHGSYYEVVSKGKQQKWVRIGDVNKRQAKRMLKVLEVKFTKYRLNLFGITPIKLLEYAEEYSSYAKTNKDKSTYEREFYAIKIFETQ